MQEQMLLSNEFVTYFWQRSNKDLGYNVIISAVYLENDKNYMESNCCLNKHM